MKKIRVGDLPLAPRNIPVMDFDQFHSTHYDLILKSRPQINPIEKQLVTSIRVVATLDQ